MDFVTGLAILADKKGDSYNLILVIVDRLIKIVYYEPVKIMIDVLDLAKVIINVVVHYHGFLKSIITDQGLLFTSKFSSSLCYFLEIKKKLFIAFYLLINGQTES